MTFPLIMLWYIFINVSFTLYHSDGDGVLNDFDNCPDLPNAEQSDKDNDTKGKKIPVLLGLSYHLIAGEYHFCWNVTT